MLYRRLCGQETGLKRNSRANAEDEEVEDDQSFGSGPRDGALQSHSQNKHGSPSTQKNDSRRISSDDLGRQESERRI